MDVIKESELIGKKTPRALQDKWNTEYQDLGSVTPDLTSLFPFMSMQTEAREHNSCGPGHHVCSCHDWTEVPANS